jgi:4-hydroxy-tetrahydrodipicolinate synthase
MVRYEGVFSVLPTPFHQDGAIDESSLRRIVHLYLEAGVDGLTALGVTSETTRLDERERGHIVEIVLDEARGRVPLVVGTTADATELCIRYSRAAERAGAAAVMVSPPRMLALHSDAIRRHYRALADAVDVDIVVQDYPPAAGYPLEPWLLAELAREVRRVRAIKLEDPPTPLKIAQIRQRLERPDVAILGGLGGTYLLEELLAGAAGAMTGFAVPELLVGIVSRFRAGRLDEAADLFYRAVPLMRFEFQEGIGLAIRKEILRRRGALTYPGLRAPGATLDEGTRAALDRVLCWVRDQTAHLVDWSAVNLA